MTEYRQFQTKKEGLSTGHMARDIRRMIDLEALAFRRRDLPFAERV